MLVGFAVLSRWDVAPAWVSSAAAVVLVGWAGARRLVGPRDVARAAHPSFALLVLALGVAVAAVATGFLGDLVERLVPSGTSFPALLAVAVLATRARGPAHQPLGDDPAGADGRPARHHRGAGGAARPQHRLRADLDRLAGEPAVAAHPGPAPAGG